MAAKRPERRHASPCLGDMKLRGLAWFSHSLYGSRTRLSSPLKRLPSSGVPGPAGGPLLACASVMPRMGRTCAYGFSLYYLPARLRVSPASGLLYSESPSLTLLPYHQSVSVSFSSILRSHLDFLCPPTYLNFQASIVIASSAGCISFTLLPCHPSESSCFSSILLPHIHLLFLPSYLNFQASSVISSYAGSISFTLLPGNPFESSCFSSVLLSHFVFLFPSTGLNFQASNVISF